MAAPERLTHNLIVKWSGKEYKIENIYASNTVAQLKQYIYEKTRVRPERQKLLGLKFNGKPPADTVKLAMLALKPGAKIMMMGTQEENLAEIIKPPQELLDVDVIDDFDIEEEEIAFQKRDEYIAKIQKRVDNYEIKIINQPRDGKKLLVLDVDYTLFDHKSPAENGLELMRPYLHEFLTSAYEHYDIVMWSATSMKWIEAKMQELGVTTNINYKIMFILDSTAMITVHSDKYGIIETKPLGVIWGKFPQYSAENTIMFDDLRRNFLMNPQSGLKIRPFRNAHLNRTKDHELLELSKYLKNIALSHDFTKLDHRYWEKYKPLS